jgi:nuclear pore complex protein Nup155
MYKTGTFPIPKVIISQYQTKKDTLKSCLSGIWPELHRVFITIDNRLFLWNYHNTAEVNTYELVTLPIEAITLFKPTSQLLKLLPSVNIPYVLVIATESEIRLFGVQLGTAVNVISTELFTSIKGDKVNKIVVTSTGRIFYGGFKGSVNELVYFEESSMLTKKVKIAKEDRTSSWFSNLIPFALSCSYSIEDIKLDETRNVLYTFQVRSEQERCDCCIGVYNVDNTFTKICKLQQREILRRAEMEDENLKVISMEIVGILIVERTRSEDIQLLVICNNGVRIYLSFNTDIKEKFRIVAIRMPPQTILEREDNIEIKAFINPIDSFNSITKIFNTKDFVLLSDWRDASNNLILISTNEPKIAKLKACSFKGPVYLTEIISSIESLTNGSITDIREIIDCEYKESAYLPALEYYMLTTEELVMYTKPRGVDYLVQALNSDVDKIVMRYGRVETCAMLLSVICNSDDYYIIFSGNTPQTIRSHARLKERAKSCFYEVGSTIVFDDDGIVGNYDTIALSIIRSSNIQSGINSF